MTIRDTAAGPGTSWKDAAPTDPMAPGARLGAGTRDYIIQGKYDGAADEPKLAWARFVVR